MTTTKPKRNVEGIRRIVQAKLKAKRRDLEFGLKMVDQVEEDDGWVLFLIDPVGRKVSAYEFAKALADIELELRDEGIEEVLLLPALTDF